MSPSHLPTHTKQWIVEGKNGFDDLKYNESAEIPKLGDNECLVKIEGVSLNYRDLVITKGQYPFPTNLPLVPCSDGAGTVLAVGSSVTRFAKGDKVTTLFNAEHVGGPLSPEILATGRGGAWQGTLRQYGSFSEESLVKSPSNLNAMQSSALTCAGLTAWNALYGLPGRQVKTGDWVLTQGTGGVSIFGVQFAKATGARVVATTGGDSKGELLKKLGADHIINYKKTPEWGAEAKKLTGGHGFDHVIEVAGPKSMKQSLDAVALEGVITIIGFLGGAGDKDQPGFLDVLTNACIVRGVLVGSRVQMEEMCCAVEANESLVPIVDKKTFKIEEAKEAYEYMWSQKHQAKVCLDLS